MTRTLSQIASLLIGIGIVQLGNGLLTTVVSLRMTYEGFSTEMAGFIMSCYFAGQMLASRTIPDVIARVGPVRAFAAAAAILAAAALSHILLVTAIAWIILRTATGYGMAGVNMVAESWLNTRATKENRGQILAFYMITVYLMTGLGQFLLNLDSPSGYELFALATVLLTLGLVPVALTNSPAPSFGDRSTLKLRQLYRLSPLGLAGVLATGFVNSAFYGLGPIFANKIGLGDFDVSVFMGATIISGLAMQWPVGKLSDKYDRRLVLMGVFFAVAAACIAMVTVLRVHPAWTLVVACIYGGLSFTTYSLSVAHACDFLEPKDMAKAASSFVFIYCIGAVLGPMAASWFMSATGAQGLFIYAALINAALGVFAIYRMFQRPTVPKDQRAPFVAMPQNTPVVQMMAPRPALQDDKPVYREGHPLVSD